MTNNFTPYGIAYDWIAQTLYIIGRTLQGNVNIWKVFKLYPESISLVFTSTHVTSNDTVMSIVVNPFNG